VPRNKLRGDKSARLASSGNQRLAGDARDEEGGSVEKRKRGGGE